MLAFTTVGYGVVGFGFGAAFSRLLAKPSLDGGDWVALVLTVVVCALTLLGLAVAIIEEWLRYSGTDAELAVGFPMASFLLDLVIGLVLGLSWQPVAELGMILRAWLAWNF